MEEKKRLKWIIRMEHFSADSVKLLNLNFLKKEARIRAGETQSNWIFKSLPDEGKKDGMEYKETQGERG